MPEPRKLLVEAADAALIRHLAILAAAVTAFSLRAQLHADKNFLVIIAALALGNMLGFFFFKHLLSSRLCAWLQAVLALLGWTFLTQITGNIRSPFVAGFALEIALAGLGPVPIHPVALSLVAVLALWAQQFLVRAETDHFFFLQCGFLLATGFGVRVVGQAWARQRRLADDRHHVLTRKLAWLESEVDAWKTVRSVGNQAARMSHALASAAHGLRGFTSLLERERTDSLAFGRVLSGIRKVIDGMEDLSRQALTADAPAPGSRRRRTAWEDIEAVLAEAKSEAAAASPGIRWIDSVDLRGESIPMARETLRETLVILLRNAVEASSPVGRIDLTSSVQHEAIAIRVRDHGCGLTEDEIEHLFKPGFTTKKSGHGFGLYLARTIVESSGGRLAADRAEGGGMSFTLSFCRTPAGSTRTDSGTGSGFTGLSTERTA